MIRTAFAASTILASCSTAVLADESRWRDRALALAKEEPKVRDATWSEDISFWVSVDDDGTDRSGYAEYICLVLSQAGRPDGEFVSVTVWDEATLTTNGTPKRLGRADCP